MKRVYLALMLLMLSMWAHAADQHKVSGVVIDKTTNEPLIGATVIVKGTTNGVITDIDGRFSLNVPSGDILEIAFMGMTTKQVPISSAQTELTIELEEDAVKVEEVVVVGFGSQKKVNLTGSVSTVKSEDLEARPVQNVTQALQGVVPGLNVSVNSAGGELDGAMNVNIRGAGTIGDGSKSSPLVLIDGMEGDMNSINPQDIENISVLKDAAAASIYGSRAPFGVILITTKKGKQGKAVVNYNNSFRLSSPIKLPETLDSYRFALYFNEAARNEGENPIFDEETLGRILAYQRGDITTGTVPSKNGDRWDYYERSNGNENWFKNHYKPYSFSQEHNLSINGGGEKTQYYLSGNILDQDGLLKYSDDNFGRYAFTAKINTQVTDWAQVNATTKFTRQSYNRASYQGGLLYHNISRLWPTVPMYDNNGFHSEPSEIEQLLNGGRQKEEKDIFTAQVQAIFEPIKNWKIIGEAAFRTSNRFEHWDVQKVYFHDVNGNQVPLAWSDYAPGNTRVNEYVWKENFFNPNIYTEYSRTFADKHNFKFMAGFQAESNNSRDLGGYRNDIITPSLPTIDSSSGDDKITDGGYDTWATAGFFGRLNYDYNGRYMAEVNLRYDGTSRFMRDQRWNLFPSVSLGWNIAQEKFFENRRQTVSTLKLRASYGALGNQNTSSLYPFYQTMPFFASNGGWLVDGVRPNYANAPSLVSTFLTWERVESWNAGIDFGLFRNRLTGSADFFVRNTKDMVGPAPSLPATLGTTVPKMNNADMQTKGWELELGWRDVIGDFSYGARLALSDSQSKITRYPNETGDISKYYVGRKFGEIWGYETVGIAKNDAEMQAHLSKVNQNAIGNKWAAGDVMYRDLNGDGKIDSGKSILSDHGDKRIIGNNTPRYNFGITLDAAYKGFDASMFFQGTMKRDLAVGGSYFWGADGGNVWQSSGFNEHYDFFREEGHPMGANTNAYYPRPMWGSNKNKQTQTAFLQNGAYLRLKNVQVGYTLPRHISQKAAISKMRVFLSADNLFTVTKLSSMFDPETVSGNWGDGKTYPLSRVFSAGVNITF